jgi:hypothetical protein
MRAHPPSAIPADAAPPPREKLDRWLHRTYFRTTGIHHWISRRLRPAGIGIGLVLVIAACLGIGDERTSTYQLFSLCLAMILLGLPWAFFRRAGLEARREVPRYATTGEPLRYAVRVQNIGKRVLKRAWLTESPPDPRPGRVEFSIVKEPGEEERNKFDRHFAYFRWQWLLLRNRLFTENPSQDEIRLPPAVRRAFSWNSRPLRAG